MEAHPLRSFTLRHGMTLALLLSAVVMRAQELDSTSQIVPVPGDTTLLVESKSIPVRGVGIKLHKMSSNKNYLILKGQVVRVLCARKKGMQKIKGARLIEVNGHDLTFKPLNSHYPEVTYADSTLRYIAFTTRWTIIRGILVNTLVLAVYALEILIIPVAILTGDAQYISSLGSGTAISFDDFHKHIRFFRRGDRRWEVVVLTNSFSRT